MNSRWKRGAFGLRRPLEVGREVSGREGKMLPNHCVESNMFLNLSLEGIFYIIEMASV